MYKKSIRVSLLLFLVAMVVLGSQISLAQDNYPTKEIVFIVPWAAGGSSDVFCRAMTSVLDKYLGKAAVVVNKPGGATIPGTMEIVNSKPDGYTVGYLANGVLTLRPNLVQTPYSLDDFEILMGVSSLPLIVSVQNESPWETFDDLVQELKENPGNIRFGSSGANQFPHIAATHLCKILNTSLKHIPFEGGAPAVAALLGGHVDFIAQNPSEIKSHIANGTLRALATLEDKRLDDFPDVPTVKELGYDIRHTVWNIVVLPDGVPKARVEKLKQALAACLQDPKVKEIITKAGSTIDFVPQEQAQKYIKEEFELYSKLLKEMK